MGTTKLSHELLSSGFFSALGTTECAGGEQTLVRRGTPKTYASKNGVFVLYDEEGCPWIARGHAKSRVLVYAGSMLLSPFYSVAALLAKEYDCKQGANVPHSNDGGHFVREVLPNL